MAKSNIESEIRILVDTFVGDLTEMIRTAALQSVQEALAGEHVARAPKSRKAATTPKKAAKGKRVRRSAAQVEQLGNTIQAHIRKNPGQRLGEIASALGVETKDARRPAFALIEEGKLTTTGQRGGTRYFVKDTAPKKAAPKKKTASKKAGKKKAPAKKAAKKKTAKGKTTA